MSFFNTKGILDNIKDNLSIFTRGTKTVLKDQEIETGQTFETDAVTLEDTIYTGEITATDGRLEITAQLLDFSTEEVVIERLLTINEPDTPSSTEYSFTFDTEGYRKVKFLISHGSGSSRTVNQFRLIAAGASHLYKELRGSNRKSVKNILVNQVIPNNEEFESGIFTLEETVYNATLNGSDGRFSLTAQFLDFSTEEIVLEKKLPVRDDGGASATEYSFIFDTEGYRKVKFLISHPSGSPQTIRNFILKSPELSQVFNELKASKQSNAELEESITKRTLNSVPEPTDAGFEGLFSVLGLPLLRMYKSLPFSDDFTVDRFGNIYAGSGGFLVKINPYDEVLWMVELVSGASHVVLDHNHENVFVCFSDRIAGFTVNGVLLWENIGMFTGYGTTSFIRRLSYRNDKLYFCARNGIVGRIDPADGTIEMYKDGIHDDGVQDPRGVDADSDGNIYSVGRDVIKINANGDVQWESDVTSGNGRSLRIDNKGNVFAGFTNTALRKYNPATGENTKLIWPGPLVGGSVADIGIDTEDKIYVIDTDGAVLKLDNDIDNDPIWKIKTTQRGDGIFVNEMGYLYFQVGNRIYKTLSDMQIKGFRIAK